MTVKCRQNRGQVRRNPQFWVSRSAPSGAGGDRYEAEGAEGLYDRRLGRLSARRAPVDEVARVLELFDTRYRDFTAKHFHEKLVAEHGCERSYNWVRLTLQAYGRRRAAPRRGAHRRKRPRRALPGMMLHQDGSSHEWVPGRWWDLIVTMDDATSDIYSAFFVAEEGTMSSFQGVSEAIRAAAHSGEYSATIWMSLILIVAPQVKALGTQVMVSRTLLKQLATVSGPEEPLDTGHSHNPADDAGRAHRVNGEVPTTPTAEARNRGRL